MNLIRLLTGLMMKSEVCPWCGSIPGSRDHDHQDDCATLDTCGQFGPPWVLDELHADNPRYPTRQDEEPLSLYYARANEWNSVRRQHLREVHGFEYAV